MERSIRALRIALARVERAIDAVGNRQVVAHHIAPAEPAMLERMAGHLRQILGGYAEVELPVAALVGSASRGMRARGPDEIQSPGQPQGTSVGLGRCPSWSENDSWW
jgi:hypothetical protein